MHTELTSFSARVAENGTVYWAAFAVISAAIIAGFVALFGHLVARSNTKLQVSISRETARLAAEQSLQNARISTALSANLKLAEMRQAWINSLRDDMAAFQSIAVTPRVDQRAREEFYRLGTRIELFMNPDDPDYKALSNALYGFLSADSLMEKYSANPDFVLVCQRILKREWDVLKSEVKAVAEM